MLVFIISEIQFFERVIVLIFIIFGRVVVFFFIIEFSYLEIRNITLKKKGIRFNFLMNSVTRVDFRFTCAIQSAFILISSRMKA